MQKISKSLKDTEKIAKNFTIGLKPNKRGATLVALQGELGTGKTAFAQAMAKCLGVKRKVKSPTFVLVRKYFLPTPGVHKSFLASKKNSMLAGENFYERPSFKFLFHIDAYRLKNHKELLALGLAKILADPKHLILIEWPENIRKALPKKRHQIHISHMLVRSLHRTHRKFKIKKVQSAIL